MPLSPSQILEAATKPPSAGGGGSLRYLARRNAHLTPAETRMMTDLTARPAPDSTVEVPPVPRAPLRRLNPTGLSPADLAWIAHLPADPAKVDPEDATHLALLHASTPPKSSDRRIAAAAWEPVIAHFQAAHDNAKAANAAAMAPQDPPASAHKALAEAHMRTAGMAADDAAAKASRDLLAATAHRARQHAEQVAGLGTGAPGPGPRPAGLGVGGVPQGAA